MAKISPRTMVLLFELMVKTNSLDLLRAVYQESGKTGRAAYRYSNNRIQKAIDLLPGKTP